MYEVREEFKEECKAKPRYGEVQYKALKNWPRERRVIFKIEITSYKGRLSKG